MIYCCVGVPETTGLGQTAANNLYVIYRLSMLKQMEVKYQPTFYTTCQKLLSHTPPGIAQLPFEQGALSIPVFLSLWIHQTLDSQHACEADTHTRKWNWLFVSCRSNRFANTSFLYWLGTWCCHKHLIPSWGSHWNLALGVQPMDTHKLYFTTMTFPRGLLKATILKDEPDICHILVTYDHIHIVMNIFCSQVESV